ncbi:MAG: tRNA lysidine(34) synthetase TilS [Ignavibacteriaceae bacterium]|nr:tRNA lysidine(34) synthetase TilS [Ignavibacteriaceae bacterium]
MKKTEEKVIKFIAASSLIEKGDKILVALSGGPDSVFLLHFLNKYQRKYKIELGAFHLNHKLRGKAADQDEKFCGKFCDKLKIKYFSSVKNVQAFAKKNKISVEEAGRIIRYKLLKEISNKHNYSKITTAHIQDDNTETVFLNLIKGSGITGMSGIPAQRENIIRPVLCLSKDEILDYLHFHKISYRIDESNLSEDYERNYLRKQIIPFIKERLNPSLDETVFNSSLVFQSVKDFFDKNVSEFLNHVVTFDDQSLTINIKFLPDFHKSIITESIREAVRNKWEVNLNFSDVTRILELTNKQSGLTIELSENLVVLKDRRKLIIKKKSSIIDAKKVCIKVGESLETDNGAISIKEFNKNKIKYSADSNIEYISGDNLSKKLIIRKWQNGDKFIPLGMKGEKKVSDFLIDIKMSRLEKQNQFVLVDGDKIIWLIGKRVDNRFKITDETKKVLQLCWKPNKTL